MNLRSMQFPALLIASLAVAVVPAVSQTGHTSSAAPAAQQSPFSGTVVEEVVARVNDQIITRSDYDRALQDMEQQARQQNVPQAELDARKRDLLRDLVDQQLLLAKGKELGITGETELVHELDNIRKQNHFDSMEDLQKAAESQGVNYEDFKANIRNRIITQQVIRDEVGRRLNLSPADVQRYYDQHKEEYNRPETVRLSEILVPTGASDTPEQIAAAQAKAEALEARLKSGDKFADVAKSASGGQTASDGGELGEFKRGQLAKVLEDQTFALQKGQYTAPIRTKQGFIILQVTDHTPGGQATLKEVEPQVEDALAQEAIQPAVRSYLQEARLEAYIDYKPGYVDSAAVVNPSKPVYSAYTPPAPKHKKAQQRTRFRQRGQRRGSTRTASKQPASAPSLAEVPQAGSDTTATAAAATAPAATTPAPAAAAGKTRQPAVAQTQKAGKKEKIRFGQAPRETLPESNDTRTVDAGALQPGEAAGAANGQSSAEQTVAEATAPDLGPGTQTTETKTKTRFSARAKLPKEKKVKGGPKVDPYAPPPPTVEETASRQTQSAPLGLAGDTAKAPKKPKPTSKTRLQGKPKEAQPEQQQPAAPASTSPSTTPSTTPAATPQTTPPAPPSGDAGSGSTPPQ